MLADDGALCLEQRRRALARMADEVFDVAIIGGGVVGCGAALDAATRGLRVALIEARDLASGTSSRSSKLIHGGLRYLEHLEFGLVSEALHERAGMLDRLAPHLVRPLPFLLLLSRRAWERPYVGAGLLLYDTMGTTLGRARGVPGQRHYTKRATLRRFPGLREDAFTGSIQYFDAQVDDARYTLFLARTAAAHGTQIASRAQAVSLLREEGGVVGVGVVDLEAPRRPLIELRARRTINATGVWADEIQALAGAHDQLRLQRSKGVHLVVPRDRIDGSTALTIRTEKSVLFVIPWGAHWIVGTTGYELGARPGASRRVAQGSRLPPRSRPTAISPRRCATTTSRAFTRDCARCWSGDAADTSSLSREHVVTRPLPGLVSVAGGKYTTYRLMARDAVDAAVEDLPEAVPASVTDRVQLLGADGYLPRLNATHAHRARQAAWTSQRFTTCSIATAG